MMNSHGNCILHPWIWILCSVVSREREPFPATTIAATSTCMAPGVRNETEGIFTNDVD